ncbi:hypothetical protein P5V15_012582 [Pogonomyrmex californicus]
MIFHFAKQFSHFAPPDVDLCKLYLSIIFRSSSRSRRNNKLEESFDVRNVTRVSLQDLEEYPSFITKRKKSLIVPLQRLVTYYAIIDNLDPCSSALLSFPQEILAVSRGNPIAFFASSSTLRFFSLSFKSIVITISIMSDRYRTLNYLCLRFCIVFACLQP